MTTTPGTMPPVHRSVTVRWDQTAAFRRFTDGISSWWPMRSHSVGQERTERIVFEGKVGGEIYEVMRGGGGERSVWGTVTEWEPPHRVGFTWHPGDSPSAAQDIDVHFVSVPNGTRLELTHSGWERLGAMARKARVGYNIGWAYVLAVWAGRTRPPLVIALNGLGKLLQLKRRLQERSAS